MAIMSKEIQHIDFFGSNAKIRSGSKRQEILSKNIGRKHSEEYLSYGYDYFDNPEYGIGYGGYQYDGRYAESAKKIFDHYGLKKGSKVLEIGCAKGFVLVEFKKLGCEVAGIDASEYAVEQAHPELKGLVHTGDAAHLEFQDDHFDLVFGKEVLPHLPEEIVGKAISECLRVSKGPVFFEIQTGENEKELQDMFGWDQTHQSIRPPSWWQQLFEELGYRGDVNFKILMRK